MIESKQFFAKLTDNIDLVTSVNTKVYTVGVGKQVRMKISIQVRVDGTLGEYIQIMHVPAGGTPHARYIRYYNIFEKGDNDTVILELESEDEVWIEAVATGSEASIVADGQEFS